MKQERLNGLATLFIHNDINVNIDNVLDRYGRKHKRRMTVKNILHSDETRDREDDIFTSDI